MVLLVDRLVRIGRLGEAGFLALPVGLAFDDEFVGGRLQPVHGGLGEEWIGHHGQDLGGSRLLVMMVEAVRWRSTISS